ncbi:MAG: hypothetical protein NTW87_36955 [Planctomycetota bacterium]|nr:hypothetical protein [Planctomycetota bacterium]
MTENQLRGLRRVAERVVEPGTWAVLDHRGGVYAFDLTEPRAKEWAELLGGTAVQHGTAANLLRAAEEAAKRGV